MKLMMIVVRDTDDEEVVQELIRHGYGVTRMASTGGFLRRGNITLMVGLQDDQVDDVLEVLHQKTMPAEPGLSRATVFVVDMPYFEKI